MANSVDSDHSPHPASSDQVYAVCSDMSAPIFRVIMVHLFYCYDFN